MTPIASVATTATAIGTRTSRQSAPALTRRQASNGPIPVKSTRTIPSGAVYWSNQGVPSDDFSPVTASEISGKNVPQKTTTTSPTRSRLLTRKMDSREASDSIRRSLRRSSRRLTISPAEPITTTAISASSGPPTVDAPKAWIDSRIPERTRKVPSRQSVNVPRISDTFHTFSIPRFSCTITECRKAVPSSHGISAAFSTASQPQ